VPPSHLKKATGGLVELEFAVRLLQLQHAASCPDLRRSDVMGALDILADMGGLSSWDFSVLRDAYLLYRRVENRIRMMQGRSESHIPEDADARNELAHRLGLERDLADLVQGHQQAVHGVYKSVVRAAKARAM